MATAFVVLVLSLLLGLQPVTTDLYLPALPGLTRDFHAPVTAGQMTLSALIIAFGLGQMAWGPAADRWGRRPVLLVGMVLYVAAALLAAAAGSIDLLIAARALQGVGLAAGVMCARAMVRDLFEPVAGAQMMARALTGLGVMALSAPIVGGLLAGRFGWRATMLATAVFGAALLLLIGLRLEETLAHRNPEATRIRPMLRTWRLILSHRTFTAWAALAASTYAGLYTFLAGSAFVLIEVLGVSRERCGLLVATSSVSYMAGTVFARRWIRRHGLAGATRHAARLMLASCVLMAGLALAGVHTVWAFMLPQYLYSFAHGVNMPCSQAGVVAPFPRNAGAASALSGFIMGLMSFGMGLWLGYAIDGTVYPVALSIAFWGAVSAAVILTRVRRHGDPGTAD